MLTDLQKKQVAAWVGEGLSLAQIQTRIGEEFGVSMTYMDVRFLVDDLDLELRDPVEEKPAVPAEKAPDAASSPADVPADAPEAEPAPAPAGGVSLSVDAVQAPGVLASGDVTFSDGVSGKWFCDSRGLGLEGFPAGYRPPQTDVPEFQKKLALELRKLGLA